MHRKRKGFWAVPVSAQRRLAAAVSLKVASRDELCEWWTDECGDVCGSDWCYTCHDEDDRRVWDREMWQGLDPQFMCLSRRSRALALLGVEHPLDDPCDCDECRFHGFGTIGDLMRLQQH